MPDWKCGLGASAHIIGESLTSEILTFEGIKATQELAKSQNAKIVVIGSGKNSLPLILDDQALSADTTKIMKDKQETSPSLANPQPGQLPTQ